MGFQINNDENYVLTVLCWATTNIWLSKLWRMECSWSI